jgi:hypothetical protein
MCAVLASGSAGADNFASAHYDARTDQLVVTMIYGGTNPNHTFELQWGECRNRGAGPAEIDAAVIDHQWDDAAKRDYRRTVKFSLEGLHCRPARVTLRTPPRFYYTLLIPRATDRRADLSHRALQ